MLVMRILRFQTCKPEELSHHDKILLMVEFVLGNILVCDDLLRGGYMK